MVLYRQGNGMNQSASTHGLDAHPSRDGNLVRAVEPDILGILSLFSSRLINGYSYRGSTAVIIRILAVIDNALRTGQKISKRWVFHIR